MLWEWNDDVTYYALFIACIAACEKVSLHELVAASMQRALREGNSLALRKWKSESIGNWCNVKGIQSAYFQYDSDISKCKQSFRLVLRSINAASIQILSNIDANSCLWRHSFITFVHFKLYFYSIKITLETGRLINIDKLAVD